MQHFMGPPFGPPQPMHMMQQSMFPQGPVANPMAGFGPGSGGAGLAKGTGLLSRLFGGGAGPTAAGFGQATTGLSGMNFTSMLVNAQRVLGITQQVVPMVQQYGPLIRNMPTIWRIMRSNNNQSSETEIDPDTTQEASVHLPIDEGLTEPVKEPTEQLSKPKTINGIPSPKLYI